MSASVDGARMRDYRFMSASVDGGRPGKRADSMIDLFPPASPARATPLPPGSNRPYEPRPPTQWDLAEMGESRGRKKALLIGINYKGTSAELKTCVNDVKNMQYMLWSNFDIQPSAMLLLFDEGNTNPATLPTRKNIVNGIRWLLDGATAGSSLVFHYSGHGSQMQDANGDPADGFDETICPCDFETHGYIADDQLNDYLVKPLPTGCKLTGIMDCCHANTGLDLLYRHRAFRTHERPGGIPRPATYPVADPPPTTTEGPRVARILGDWVMLRPKKREIERKGSADIPPPRGEVVVWSGFTDPEAPPTTTGPVTGAMTYALIVCVERNRHRALSFAQALDSCRKELKGKYPQIPQLSTGRPFDLYSTHFDI